MPVDARTEAALRKMLGHAIRDEIDDLYALINGTGPEVYEAVTRLAVLASGYITIDVSKRPPAEADYREIAKIGAEAVSELPVSEDEMYGYLSQVVFGFRSTLDMFPGNEGAPLVPLFTLARLLISFTPKGKGWTDYLDTIWNATEASEKAGLALLPSLTYQHLVLTAQAGTKVRPSTS